jgi:hypothetical protein
LVCAHRRPVENDRRLFFIPPQTSTFPFNYAASPLSQMDTFLSTLAAIIRDPVLYHGALGFFAVVTLERLNAFVGLLVGLATLVYLCLRIRDQLKHRNAKPSAED